MKRVAMCATAKGRGGEEGKEKETEIEGTRETETAGR